MLAGRSGLMGLVISTGFEAHMIKWQKKITLRAFLFCVLAMVLFAYAFLNNAAVAAGLTFDIIGALFLLWAEIKAEAANEIYWSSNASTSPEAQHHLAKRKELPYHERFPLWLVGVIGSRITKKETKTAIIMAMGQEPVDEALPRKFWAFCFLITGFSLQLIGSGKLFTARFPLF